MTAKIRRPLLLNLTWASVALLWLAVVFVLSYAPVVRFCGGTVRNTNSWGFVIVEFGDARRYPAYRPVDWLIDNTPISEPLFWWARIFGVEGDFRDSAEYRARYGYGYQ